MPVTELALLHLKAPTTADTPAFHAGLRKAKHAMENFTGHEFFYLQQVEDPDCIYILGEWDSLQQHYNEFIPSDENKSLLESLKDVIEVEWLSHLDVPVAQIQLISPYLSIGRHMIKEGVREKFETCFQEKRTYLDRFVTEGRPAGGWKIDDDRKGEEFVLFSPWKEVQQHMDFAQDDGFKEYAAIREFVSGADIKHVKILEVME